MFRKCCWFRTNIEFAAKALDPEEIAIRIEFLPL